jgi:lysophospholipase L1-like esterase
LRPQRELLAAGERLGVPTLDLTPAFARWTAEHADPADVPFLDVHFSAPGHRLAALEIARFLRERGLAE